MTLDRASALLDLGRPQDALVALAQAGEDAGSGPGQCLRALAHLRLGELRLAASAAGAARAAAPSHEWGFRLGAIAALRAGELRRAVGLAQEAVALAPDEELTHQVAAVALLHSGDIGAARRHGEQMLRLAPDAALSHQTYGRVLLVEGRTAEAEAALRTALELDPQDAESMSLLASATAAQGRGQEATELRLAAVRAAPQDARHRADLLRRGGSALAGGALVAGKAGLLTKLVAVNVLLRGAGGLGWGLLWLLAPLYALTFAGTRLRRARLGRTLPPAVWEGLRPTRRNRDLLWCAWPAALLVLVLLRVLVTTRSVGALVGIAAGALFVALCWRLRQGDARAVTAATLGEDARRTARVVWERQRLRAQGGPAEPVGWVRGDDPTPRDRWVPAFVELLVVLGLGNLVGLHLGHAYLLGVAAVVLAAGALVDGRRRAVRGHPSQVVLAGGTRPAGQARLAVRALLRVVLLPVVVLHALAGGRRLPHDRLSGCELIGLVPTTTRRTAP